MGFKCPSCHKDFGIDRMAFYQHVKKCNDGEADAIITATITGDTTKLKKQMKKKSFNKSQFAKDSFERTELLTYENHNGNNGFLDCKSSKEVLKWCDDHGYVYLGICKAPYPHRNLSDKKVKEEYCYAFVVADKETEDVSWIHISYRQLVNFNDIEDDKKIDWLIANDIETGGWY